MQSLPVILFDHRKPTKNCPGHDNIIHKKKSTMTLRKIEHFDNTYICSLKMYLQQTLKKLDTILN